MNWDKYAICKSCGAYEHDFHNFVNIFDHICGKCGESSWDTEIIGREIWIGVWWNPLTFFDYKLELKDPLKGKEKENI